MPAGLPKGRPGRGLLIDGAVQQAAQPERQAGGDVRRDAKVMPAIVGLRAGAGLN